MRTRHQPAGLGDVVDPARLFTLGNAVGHGNGAVRLETAAPESIVEVNVGEGNGIEHGGSLPIGGRDR
jgi:hypothetical protein